MRDGWDGGGDGEILWGRRGGEEGEGRGEKINGKLFFSLEEFYTFPGKKFFRFSQ